MNKLSFWTGALLVTAPVLALIPGCGGGNDGVTVPTSTPTATATLTGTTTPSPTTNATPTATGTRRATPTATGTVAANQSSKFVLSNGQKGILHFAFGPQKFSGSIEILDSKLPTQSPRPSGGLSSDLQPGVYLFTSSPFVAGEFFQVDALQNGVKVFQMRGTAPTASLQGSFVLQRGLEHDFGPLYKVGQDFPSAVPTATPTRVPFDSVQPHLTFKASSDSNFVPDAPYYASINPGGTSQNVSLTFATSGGARLDGILGAAKAGKVYTPTSPDLSELPKLTNLASTTGTVERVFTFQGGRIEVTNLSKAYCRLTFNNVVFAPSANASGGATGTVTVSGTIDGPIDGDFIGV